MEDKKKQQTIGKKEVMQVSNVERPENLLKLDFTGLTLSSSEHDVFQLGNLLLQLLSKDEVKSFIKDFKINHIKDKAGYTG